MMSHLPRETGAGSAGYEPISYTARKILQKRARHTNIPYAREMAEAVGVEWRVSRAREWARHLVWGRVRSGLFLQFRHDAISSALQAYPLARAESVRVSARAASRRRKNARPTSSRTFPA
jgi:hypothetical protein